MAESTNIGWCDSTVNFWIGCTEVSPACAPCYAREWAARRYPAAKWGDHPRVRTSKSLWDAPLGWNRRAVKEGKRPFVFTNSLADIFDNQVDPQWRRDAFDVIRATPALVWLLLTKRPGNIVGMCNEAGGLPRNAALGATFANQDEYQRDAHKLAVASRAQGALFSFGSFEPLLSAITLNHNAPHWVIVGGMSGDTWRDHELPPDWVRAIRDRCAEMGLPFYFKQWSARYAKLRGCSLDGREHKERPSVAPLPREPESKPREPQQPELFAA